MNCNYKITLLHAKRKKIEVKTVAMSLVPESTLQNLLSAVTDALLRGEEDIDEIVAQHQVARPDVENWLKLIRTLHGVLVGVQPSPAFARRLESQLMGPSRASGLIRRVRRLPARVQIAALIALLAGFMLITRRRLLEETRRDIGEAPALR